MHNIPEKSTVLPHTTRLLTFHRYLSALIALVVVVGASISAIQIGEAPVLGPIIVFLIMAAFYAVAIWQNRTIQAGLAQGLASAWLKALFFALIMSLLIVGIPAARELLSRDVRHAFLQK
jgi:hypothetical protein